MLNPSFTRGEFWLLNAVIYLELPINKVIESNIDIFLNCQHHNLPTDVISTDLFNLYQQGLIEVSFYDGDNDQVTDNIQLSQSLLHDIFYKPPQYYQYFYQLSAKGAEYWQNFTCPSWDYFVFYEEEMLNIDSYKTDGIDKYKVTLASQTKRLLHGYLANFYEGIINSSSIQWSHVDEFAVLYWKKLPNVHIVTFEYQEYDNNDYTDERHIKEQLFGFSQTVNDKMWCNWYF